MNDVTRTIALPVSTQDLLAHRKPMRERTLNDHVDDIHVALWEVEEYHRALEAVYDEDAIEGSLAADNLIAAQFIRKYAQDNNNPHVKTKKLATIVKSLNVVLRRYGITRKERAIQVGDESYPAPDPNDNGK
jgi:hypothetical protein